MSVLITGVAGFIGMSVAYSLLKDGIQVYGLDNLNNYYDVELKNARLQKLESFGKKFEFFNFIFLSRKNIKMVQCSFDHFNFKKSLVSTNSRFESM